MGVKETLIWTFEHTTSVGQAAHLVKTAKKMIDNTNEKGLVDGTVETYKSEIKDTRENSPLTAPLYRSAKQEGFFEGKKEGIKEQSQTDSIKYTQLEEAFLQLKNELQTVKEKSAELQKNNDILLRKYEVLLDKFTQEISSLENKLNRTEEENSYLNNLVQKQQELIKMFCQ